MKYTIQLEVEYKDHFTVELTNGKGDTFTYDPNEHEEFESFLLGTKIIRDE